MNVVEPFQRMARQQPDRPAFIVDGQATTYGRLLAHVSAMAAGFLADGVRPGDRVAVIGGPALRVVSTLALGWIGAVSAEMGGMPDERLGEMADALGIDAVYAPRDLDLRGAKARAAHTGGLLAAGRAAAAPQMWDCGPEAPWRIAISSGTTGRPKGIMCSHASIVNVHLLRTIYPCGPGDTVVIVMNAAMSFAVHNWLRCFYNGACVVLAELMPAAELLDLLQGDQPTHCVVTPASANVLASLCTRADAPAPAAGKRLHTLTLGGGLVSQGVRETLGKHICPNVLAHYGGAEMHIVAVLDPQLSAAQPSCSGRLLPWIEAHAVGATGEVLPPGEAGRLRFRSPALATGYVGHTDDAAFRGGWFLSQDVGAVWPDGLVFLRGRANDVINLAGLKLDPEMVEKAIMADRAIVECAVVDVAGALGPQLVAIIVDPSGSADVEALAARCEKAVPGVRLQHVLRAEKIPRNANGKVMRAAVRRSVQESLREGGNAS